MKKKILAISLAIAMLAVALVGASLAFFTDTDTKTNTFTVGNVDITLDEPSWTDSGKLIPGRTIKKDPTVTVETPSEKCYVRLLVTVNNMDVLDAMDWKALGISVADNEKNPADLIKIFNGYVNTEWEYITNTKSDDGKTRTYEFRYIGTKSTTGVIDASAADVVLPALFESVTVPNFNNLYTDANGNGIYDEGDTLDINNVNNLKDFTITVVAQAIQAEGFDTAADAWVEFK